MKIVLDILRGGKSSWHGGCSALAVCASAWLCAHVRLVHHDALLKPMNMVQQLGSCNASSFISNNGGNTPNSAMSGSSTNDDLNQLQDSYKERCDFNRIHAT